MTARTRTDSQPGTLGTHTHTYSGGALAPVTVRLSQFDRSMSDVVTPGFGKVIRSGAVVMNPCSLVISKVRRSGGGVYHATSGSLTSHIAGSGSLTSFLLQYFPVASLSAGTINLTDMINEAQSKALANIDKAPYSVAEDLATIGQTLKYLRNPVKTFSELAEKFAKDKRRIKTSWERRDSSKYRSASKPRKTADQLIADLWLEYRFAFMPTVQSMSTILASLSDMPIRLPIRSSHGTAQRPTLTKKDTAVGGQFTYKRTAEYVAECKATVLYTVTPPLRDWQSQYGLRFKDIPELMWDLFPYSFMYDRVIDVGSAIRGFTNFVDPSVKIGVGCVTMKATSKSSLSCVSQNNPSWTIFISPDVDESESFSYTRTIWYPTLLDVVPPVLPGNLLRDASSIVDLLTLGLQKLR